MPQVIEKSQLKFTVDDIEGLEVAQGSFKTPAGTIRVPQSKLRGKKQPSPVISTEKPHETPRQEVPRCTGLVTAPEQVSFVTPMGTMQAMYSPVIDQGNFLVLGMLPQSFTPVSYSENKDLVLTVKGTSFKDCKVVFTGCKFTDPLYRTTYMILMKV